MEFFVARPGLPVCVVRFSFVSKKRLSIPQTIVHYEGDIRQPEKMGSMSFRVESNTVTGASPARTGWPAGA
ncbi:hypothetical protein, partial [Burkholderia vietnamiensis]|uniref:hypothetical protein n=1 Tax=Burkholderia vietnamiensis TaxID=60552 RepID=UPI001E3BA7AD